jgi:hypothetical protein
METRTSFLESGQFYACQRAQEPFWDHQAQVSVVATCRSSTAGDSPQGPQSALWWS